MKERERGRTGERETCLLEQKESRRAEEERRGGRKGAPLLLPEYY